MEKNNDLMSGKGEKGEWKTINGAHVYVADGQSVEDAMNKQFRKNNENSKSSNKDIQSMTRVELAKELYQAYLKTGSTPIGSDKPLTEQQYIKRYLSGVGASNGFSKQALQDLVQKARNGKYGGSDISKQQSITNSNNDTETQTEPKKVSTWEEAQTYIKDTKQKITELNNQLNNAPNNETKNNINLQIANLKYELANFYDENDVDTLWLNRNKSK